jgi:hypothetical protein
MNTANWVNILSGKQEPFAPSRPWYDVATCEEALDYFRAYFQMVDPPLKEVVVSQTTTGQSVVWLASERRMRRRVQWIGCT